jgi:hypothetical protein
METSGNTVSDAAAARPSKGPLIVTPPRRRYNRTSWQTAQWVYQWSLWLFLVGLMVAQFSCAFWDSSTRYATLVAGKIPSDGLRDLAVDDVDPEPYTDRCVVCVLDGGRQYKPMQLSRALARSADTLLGEDPASIHAYRVVRRATSSRATFSAATATHYATACDLVARTLDAILDSCHALGYNVTSDYVRVVHGLDASAEVVGLTDSLPVLIEPLDDDSTTARYIVPSHDGTACIVRLLDAYDTPTATSATLILRGIERTVYEQKTLVLLGRDSASARGVAWRNGWLEEEGDATHSRRRWHAEVISTAADADAQSDTYGVRSRVFDTTHNVEVDATTLMASPVEHTWGATASTADTLLWFLSLTISNGTRFGIYHYEASQIHVARTTYTLETLLVNLSIAWVLLRWAVCMVAMRRCPSARWHAASLGSSVACMRGFHLLPLVLLVRLKPILATFWTVGIWFSGDQRAMSEAWFIMYPSIAGLVLLQFSVINTVAKVLRRRVSDIMLGPTLACLCLLHFVRASVFVEPLPTSVSSAEMTSLSLSAMFSPLVVMRLNGHVAWLIYIKLAVLGSNWLPLCFHFSSLGNVVIRERTPCNSLERSLALRVAKLGGFGPRETYVHVPMEPHGSTAVAEAPQVSRPTAGLAPFELVRMGYVLLGDRFVLSFNDYFLLLLLAPWRRRVFPPNFRVVLFTVTLPPDYVTSSMLGIQAQPELGRLNDPRLQSVELLDIAAVTVY